MEMELPTSLLCRGVRKAADLTKPIDKRVYKVRFCQYRHMNLILGWHAN